MRRLAMLVKAWEDVALVNKYMLLDTKKQKKAAAATNKSS
jgi:hypothetical protein